VKYWRKRTSISGYFIIIIGIIQQQQEWLRFLILSTIRLQELYLKEIMIARICGN